MKKKRILVLATILIALAGVSSFLIFRRPNPSRTAVPTSTPDSGTLGLTPAGFVPQSASPAVPRAHQYSVVRNGICVPSNSTDEEEASRKKWEALLLDPFWQSIFSGVNPEKFHLLKTSLPLHRYVTYWKMENGQLIHWTGRQILIPAGTRIFTDGQGAMYLCACGNQVAAVLPPKSPATVLPPEDEPSVSYLVPPDPEVPVVSEAIPGEPAVVPPELASDPNYTVPGWIVSTPPPLAGGAWPPGIGPGPVPILGPGPGPGGGPGGPPSQPPVVPEPGTLSLTLLGLGASMLARRYRKRR